MRSQLLIFDLDGTLIDSRCDLATAVNLMRAHYGLAPLAVDTVARHVGDGVRKLVERSLPEGGVNLDEAVGLQKSLYMSHLHDESTLYPGVAEGLPALHRAGHRLAVATNKETAACEAILRHFGLQPLFSSVLGGGSTRNLKPHPEMILLTMRTVGATPADTWMVGDHLTDMESARRAGVQSVFLSCGIGHPGSETPTVAFDSFGEFVRSFLPRG